VNRELLELAGELHRLHRPFVLATVVWSRSPTSGKSGSTALIEPDGHVHGWIGGACAEPSVIREARRVLADGTGRLMYLGPAEEIDGSARAGVVTVPIACASEGALEVFMEPVLPQPHVVVVGGSPTVKTLAELLDVLDWRVTVISDDEGSGVDEMTALEIDETTSVVVASQGHYDEPALEAALASSAGYIGLISSARRADNVLGYLRDRGFSERNLNRVRVPAGLDLGRIEHREIAVAILAQLVGLRAAGELTGIPSSHPEVSGEAIDPVCHMTVEIATARWSSEFGGTKYSFCAAGCQRAFETTPAEYLPV
jgi:xanthine dehydrogenase accessory factor